jgi:hypothetical protein
MRCSIRPEMTAWPPLFSFCDLRKRVEFRIGVAVGDIIERLIRLRRPRKKEPRKKGRGSFVCRWVNGTATNPGRTDAARYPAGSSAVAVAFCRNLS